jgi:hypothetical protein
MRRPRSSRDDVLFWVGVALWVAVILVTWPRAVSFGDEVDYIDRAKLLLAGHLHYVAGSLGTWMPTPRGPIGKFPILFSVLLTPLVAVTPRWAFALPVAAAVLLATTTRDVLRSWGRGPLAALVVLAHPTIIILSRTAMADVPQAALAVAAWWACRRGRAFAMVAWLALLVGLKATGNVLAFAIVAGEAVTSRAELRARDRAAWRRVGFGALGGALGFAVGLAQKRIVNGTFASGYDAVFETIKPFALSYLPARAATHLTTLVALPPLLALGARAFWRRRDFGPLFVAGGFLAMMLFYYFADTGASRLETLVLSPRLILPVVAFLLVGYAVLLDELVEGLGRGADGPSTTAADAPAAPRWPAWLAHASLVVPLACATFVSVRHSRYLRSMGAIREIASALADAQGERTLGVTDIARKAGVLHDGPATIFDPVSNRTAAVLCSVAPFSHRDASTSAPACVFPGYHTVASSHGFYALARDDMGGDAR